MEMRLMKVANVASDSDAERVSTIEAVLAELVPAASEALGADLLSVVLFGSAAEGRLRANSDVNVLMLLKTFDVSRIDALREPLRLAHAAARVEIMFLLENELPIAAELFAVKFNDICNRHRVLYGNDPLPGLQIDAGELRRRLREVLLNLAIRLRERYALVSLREEQLVRVIAEVAGPLRASAVALLRVQGKSALAPREALEAVAATTGDDAFIKAVALLPLARQQQSLPAGAGGPALLALSRLAGHLRAELEGVVS
jgi:predicted nucleotidyltransferase